MKRKHPENEDTSSIIISLPSPSPPPPPSVSKLTVNSDKGQQQQQVVVGGGGGGADKEDSEDSSTAMHVVQDQQEHSQNIPKYGSQEYWEKRYKRNKEKTLKDSCDKDEEQDDDEEEEGEEEELSPGHEWYFSYNELQSLILPLLLGGRGEEFDQWSCSYDDIDGDDEGEDGDIVDECYVIDEKEDEDIESGGKTEEEKEDEKEKDKDGHDNKNRNRNKNNQEEIIEEEEEEEEEEQEIIEDDNTNEEECEEQQQDFLSLFQSITNPTKYSNNNSNNKNDDNGDELKSSSIQQVRKPKKVLEIGCGDMPLGRDLCNNFLEFQSNTSGSKATSIVDEIVCFDYSKTVIDDLVQEQKQQKEEKQHILNEDNLHVIYEELDARKLPYQNKTFDLIMDKGTLDAMLSDNNEGIQNCIQIVSEASRLLTVGGYLLIVSHLNACNSEGMSWVNKVLVQGLNSGDQTCHWRIEVHSSSNDEIDFLDEDNDTGGDGDVKSNSGPAVYIIRKMELQNDKESTKELSIKKDKKAQIQRGGGGGGGGGGEEGHVNSNIKVKFFGY